MGARHLLILSGLVFLLLGASLQLAEAHRPQRPPDWSEVERLSLNPAAGFVQVADARELFNVTALTSRTSSRVDSKAALADGGAPIIQDDTIPEKEASAESVPVMRTVNNRLDYLEQRLETLEQEVRATSRATSTGPSTKGSDVDDGESEQNDASNVTPPGSHEETAHHQASHPNFYDIVHWSKDEVKMVATTTALLLMFFVAFVMCILYMLHFPDEQVKSLSYKLVSTCIAILCAVLIEKAQFGKFSNLIIIGVILGDDLHHITDELELFAINFVFFLFWYTCMSVTMKRAAHNHETLYAIRLFTAHEVAFVGIHMFAGPQKRFGEAYVRRDWNPVLVIVMQTAFVAGVALFCVLFGIFGSLARRMQGRAAPQALPAADAHPGEPLQQEDVHSEGSADHHGHHHVSGELWKVEASEGEDEAAAILLSFLTRQVLLLIITGRIPGPKGDFGTHDSANFGALFGMLCIVLGIALVVRKLLEVKSHHQVPTMGERASEFVVQYFALLVGWLGLSLCRWMIQRKLSEKTLMFIGVAAWVSFPLILLIIGVDFLCDEGWLQDSTALVVIECSGLVIGISWEKAFAMAIDTINDAHSGSSSEYVLTEAGLCIGLCIILMPGWRWFICPTASQPVPKRARRLSFKQAAIEDDAGLAKGGHSVGGGEDAGRVAGPRAAGLVAGAARDGDEATLGNAPSAQEASAAVGSEEER